MESRVLHRQVFMPCRNKHKSLINVFYCCRCTFYNRVNKAKKGRVSNHEKGRFFFCQTNILTKRLTSSEKGELAHSFLQMIGAKCFATITFLPRCLRTLFFLTHNDLTTSQIGFDTSFRPRNFQPKSLLSLLRNEGNLTSKIAFLFYFSSEESDSLH